MRQAYNKLQLNAYTPYFTFCLCGTILLRPCLHLIG